MMTENSNRLEQSRPRADAAHGFRPRGGDGGGRLHHRVGPIFASRLLAAVKAATCRPSPARLGARAGLPASAAAHLGTSIGLRPVCTERARRRGRRGAAWVCLDVAAAPFARELN
eukprot:scaffold16499_cov121-Isochrysis_galbana.AAC.6